MPDSEAACSWDEMDSAILREDPGVYGKKPPFDLAERTALFGEAVIRFCKQLVRNSVNNRLTGQLVGAGTSIGANYCEATECLSRKDFRAIISRCVKETKESRFFLRMCATAEPKRAEEARSLYREATELLRILGSMYQK